MSVCEMIFFEAKYDDAHRKLTLFDINRKVVETYSATLTQMIEAENAKKAGATQQVNELQAQLSTLKQEKSQVEVDLNKTEMAFSDLHRKYEKLKEVLGRDHVVVSV